MVVVDQGVDPAVAVVVDGRVEVVVVVMVCRGEAVVRVVGRFVGDSVGRRIKWLRRCRVGVAWRGCGRLWKGLRFWGRCRWGRLFSGVEGRRHRFVHRFQGRKGIVWGRGIVGVCRPRGAWWNWWWMVAGRRWWQWCSGGGL